MTSFPLEILTPQTQATFDAVVFLDVPAAQGRLTVRPGHEPFVATLVAGAITVHEASGRTAHWTAGAGTLRVGRDGVTILSRHIAPDDVPTTKQRVTG